MTMTIWKNGTKFEGIVREGDEIIFRTGLVCNSRAQAMREIKKFAATLP